MLSIAQLNPRLRRAEYAVRGPIVRRAQELEAAGRKIVYCNIGNPQALRQPPLSYLRQTLCLLEHPPLLDAPAAAEIFPADVRERARRILAAHPQGIGAYSQSAGIPFVRQAVADFIARRDAIPARPENVILTDGASKAAQAVIHALLRDERDGFLIPIPQYPLYSATLTLLGGRQVGYFLDEAHGWELSEETLSRSLEAALAEGTKPVGLVVINPGNPTGAVLSRDNLRMIAAFARRRGLALIADEVYQENVYATGAAFHSFASVLHELGDEETPLFSLHSVSKGFLGECGHRGGYLEMRNLPEDVRLEFEKLQSISLCAGVPGQLATYLMVAPPQPGDESHATFVRERDAILGDLRAKAEILGEGINRIPGMSVDVPQGAMYAFVRFTLPDEGDDAALPPDERRVLAARRDDDYCLALLEETGICVVPGSGFGQEPGTLHFRTTFLPPRHEIAEMVVRLREFHLRHAARRAV